MLVWKIAVWHDPKWREAMWTKGNWRKWRYWNQRRKGQLFLGPWRIEYKRLNVGE